MEKARQKAWHDRHIKTKKFVQDDQVLLYDSKYQKHPRETTDALAWTLYSCEIHDSGVVRLTQLNGILHLGWVNGTCLKPYSSS
jgi:hypothetical protein